MATRTISTTGGLWNATTAWVEGAVPTSGDDVVATGTSGPLTINVAAQCRSINLTGYTSTLTKTASVAFTIGDASGGALTYPTTGWTYTTNNAGGDTYVFASTSNNGGTGWAVDFGGKTPNSMSFNGVGGKWLLTRSLNNNVNSTLTLTAGALDTNSLAHSLGSFNTSGSGVRTLTTGSSTMALAGTWDGSVTTNLTVSANTAVVTLGASFSPFLYGGTIDWNGMTFRTVSTSTFTIRESSSTTAFTTGFTVAGLSHVAAGATMNFLCPVHITGTFTTSGTSVTNRLLVTSNTLGTPQVITVGTTVTATFVDYQDITAAGAASWNLAAVTGGSGDLGGNTGITFTTPANQYWIIHTGTWAVTANWASSTGGTGGTGRIPLAQDTAIFDANSFTAGSQTVTASASTRLSAIDTSAATHTPAFSFNTPSIYGSLILTNVTFTATTLFLSGRGSHTLNIGSSTAASISIAAVTGTYTLAAALTMTAALSVDTGTFASANFAITVLTLTLSQSQTALFGTSTITLTAATQNAVVLAGTASFPTNADFSGTTIRVTGLDTGIGLTFQTRSWTFGTLHLVGTADATAGELAMSNTTVNRWAAWVLDPGMNMRFTTDQTVGSLSMNGTTFGYMRMRASGITAPHHANFEIAGDLEIIMKLRADTWTPAGQTVLMAMDSSPNNAYRFSRTTTGALELELSTNGTTFATTATSTATIPSTGVTNGTDKWVRVTRVQSTGVIQFFLGDDGTTWTQLGTNITGTTSAIFAGTAPLKIGQSSTLNGSGNVFNGRCYRAILRNGIAGTTVVDLDLTAWPAGTVTKVDSAATPKTWTIVSDPTGSPATPGHSLLGGFSGNRLTTDLVDPHGNVWTQNSTADSTYNGYVTPSSTQWLSTPSATALNLAGDLDLAVKVRATDWTPSTKQYLAVKGANATALSWRFALETSGALSLVTTTDGSTFRTATSSAATGITDDTDYWVRVTYNATTGAVRFYTSADGGTWIQLGTTQTGTAGALYASAGALYFGRGETATFNWTGRIYELILRNGIEGAIVANPDYANRTLVIVDRAVINNVVGAGGANWVATNSFSTGTNTGWTFGGAVVVLPLLAIAVTIFLLTVPPSVQDVVLPLINAPPTVFSPQVFRTGGVDLQAIITAPPTVFAPAVPHPIAVLYPELVSAATVVVFDPAARLGPTTQPDIPPVSLPSDTGQVPPVDGAPPPRTVLAAPIAQFVAVGRVEDVHSSFTSIDGKNWIIHTIGAGTETFDAVAWAPSLELWVITGPGGNWATSKDGATWTIGTRFTTADITDIAWSPARGQFLATTEEHHVHVTSPLFTSRGESIIYTSADGLHWTPRSVSIPVTPFLPHTNANPTSDVHNAVAVAWADTLGLWVIAAHSTLDNIGGTDQFGFFDDFPEATIEGLFATSPDGITWTFIQDYEPELINVDQTIVNHYHYMIAPDMDYNHRWKDNNPVHVAWSKEHHQLLATTTNTIDGVLTSSNAAQDWTGDSGRYTWDTDPAVPVHDGTFAGNNHIFENTPGAIVWSPQLGRWVVGGGGLVGLAWSPELQLFTAVNSLFGPFSWYSSDGFSWAESTVNFLANATGFSLWAWSADGIHWGAVSYTNEDGDDVHVVPLYGFGVAWGGGGSPIRPRGSLKGSGVAATMGAPTKTMTAVEPGRTIMTGNASRKDQRTAHATETRLLDPLVRLIEKPNG